MSVSLPYEFSIAIGDWSDDGHGKCEFPTFKWSHPVKKIREAYLASVAKTGLSFDHDRGEIQICAKYCENELSEQAQQKLIELGYDMTSISPEWLSVEDFLSMLLWFIKLSLPELQYEPKHLSCLNGFWNKTLDSAFGYGLFE